jgi:hypothetical protein
MVRVLTFVIVLRVRQIFGILEIVLPDTVKANIVQAGRVISHSRDKFVFGLGESKSVFLNKQHGWHEKII